MNPLKILILIVSLHVSTYAKVINVDNIVNEVKRQDKQVGAAFLSHDILWLM